MCQCTWYTVIFTLALFCALWFIAYKMEISLEKKFTSMKMPELKRFLQDRGVSVNSQLKPGLVAIACAVESMKLPLKNRVTVEEEEQNLTRRLFIRDYQLADPFTIKVENDFRSSPPFGLFGIFNHLIYHAAYKSYEEYRLFREGYVESLKACYLKEADVHVCVGWSS